MVAKKISCKTRVKTSTSHSFEVFHFQHLYNIIFRFIILQNNHCRITKRELQFCGSDTFHLKIFQASKCQSLRILFLTNFIQNNIKAKKIYIRHFVR